MCWLAVPVSQCGKEKMQKLTTEQAVVISGYTGVLACPFAVLHAEIETRMGRPVWTHELGSHELMETEIKPKFKTDFLAMIPANASMRLEERSAAE